MYVLPDLAPLPQGVFVVSLSYFSHLHEHLLYVADVTFHELFVLGYEFWILPNLFDESLTFAESFKPGYSFDPGAKGQRYYRAALLMGTVAFFAWAYNQPTDFDLFVEAQKEFIDDLYAGSC